MIDIKHFNKALKLSWIKKYVDPENHGKWKLLFTIKYSALYSVMLID